MAWRQATREDHERFCQAEGCRRVRDAQGRTGTHHVTYEVTLPDGQILRTRISHPPDRTTYGASLWSHILRDQLRVSQEAFWACVRDGTLPDRGVPAAPAEALPADLVHLLLTRVGLSEDEIRQLSRPQAIARLQQYWTEGALSARWAQASSFLRPWHLGHRSMIHAENLGPGEARRTVRDNEERSLLATRWGVADVRRL